MVSVTARRLQKLLSEAGFISAQEEAALLVEAAGGDSTVLKTMLERRLTGEPLAWILGHTSFCEIEINVLPGIYVPRPQTEQLAWRAIDRLPENGIAVDLCTGSGAIARTLATKRPEARVVASDIDPLAVECARSNRVSVYEGDLFDPLPESIKGRVDVVIAVPPYVPTEELQFLQRDTFTFESRLPYDGGPDGTVVIRGILTRAVEFLRRGGALLLELGSNQDSLLRDEIERLGYTDIQPLFDEEGDLRGLEALFDRQ